MSGIMAPMGTTAAAFLATVSATRWEFKTIRNNSKQFETIRNAPGHRERHTVGIQNNSKQFETHLATVSATRWEFKTIRNNSKRTWPP
jgi:hypothetical protein